jgi:hypothetical protein
MQAPNPISSDTRRQPRRARTALPALAALLALAGCLALLTPSARAAGPPRAHLSTVQLRYLALAEGGVAQAKARWRDPRLGWYDEVLADHERYPLATIWGIVPLFESLDAIAIADPTAGHLGELRSFAAGAERYLNHGLSPVPGYSPYPNDRTAQTETWFDDNGWWGIAFVNAYRATGDRRYLKDAQLALSYISRAGWDPQTGGIWWNTEHPYKAGEAIASGTLLATLLYQYTRAPSDLALAQKFLGWANTQGFSAAEGLYRASNLSATPIDYIEAPLIYAQALLCKLEDAIAGCERAQALTHTALQRFGQQLDFSPQYDAIYLQWMLALYALDGDQRLYAMAAENAREASANARDDEGLYLRSWAGQQLPSSDAVPGMLQTQGATTSLFAWLAVYAPPS